MSFQSVKRTYIRESRLPLEHLKGELKGRFTNEKCYLVLSLDASTPVEALKSVLAGDGVEDGLPNSVGGGTGVFDISTGFQGHRRDLGNWSHCCWGSRIELNRLQRCLSNTDVIRIFDYRLLIVNFDYYVLVFVIRYVD